MIVENSHQYFFTILDQFPSWSYSLKQQLYLVRSLQFLHDQHITVVKSIATLPYVFLHCWQHPLNFGSKILSANATECSTGAFWQSAYWGLQHVKFSQKPLYLEDSFTAEEIKQWMNMGYPPAHLASLDCGKWVH